MKHSFNTSSLATLLAAGHTRSEAAAALGVTPSAVTQLAESMEVSEQIDSQYDEIENMLLKQLKRTVPTLLRPAEIANVLTRVNQAKRRGSLHQDNNTPQTVINLNLPTSIQNKFVLNSSNQVVSAGTQELVTIPSGAVTKLLEAQNESKQQQLTQTDEFGFSPTNQTNALEPITSTRTAE